MTTSNKTWNLPTQAVPPESTIIKTDAKLLTLSLTLQPDTMARVSGMAKAANAACIKLQI